MNEEIVVICSFALVAIVFANLLHSCEIRKRQLECIKTSPVAELCLKVKP